MIRSDELIQRYFDGDLPVEQEEEFLALLRADRNNVRAFVREANLRRTLREALCESVGVAGERQIERSYRRRVFVPLATAAALVVAAGVWWWHSPREAGPTIATGAAERLILQFENENIRVEMAGNSMVKLAGCSVARHGTNVIVKSGVAKVVRLEYGAIRAVVARQSGGRTFSVKSGREEIFVAGTVFSVGVFAKGSTLSVEEGRVVMRLLGSDVCESIEQGQEVYTRTGAGRIFAPVSILRSKSIPELKYTDAGGLAFDGKRLWMWCVDERGRLRSGRPSLLAVDPDSFEVFKSLDPGAAFESWSQIAWDGQYIWGHGRYFMPGGNRLNAVDIETGAGVKSLALPDEVSGRVHFDIRDGVAWVWYGTGVESGDSRNWIKIRLADGAVLARGRLDEIDWDVERTAWLPDCFVLGERRGNRLAKINAGSGKLMSVELLTRMDFWFGGDMAYDPARGLWLSSKERAVLYDIQDKGAKK